MTTKKKSVLPQDNHSKKLFAMAKKLKKMASLDKYVKSSRAVKKSA
jgi:hypothetical protein